LMKRSAGQPQLCDAPFVPLGFSLAGECFLDFKLPGLMAR
jgi:hypothetical protein